MTVLVLRLAWMHLQGNRHSNGGNNMSFTLATLKTAVKDYCETSESTFDTQLTTFIQEAEERILKMLSFQTLERM